jgi:hypothetical protein
MSDIIILLSFYTPLIVIIIIVLFHNIIIQKHNPNYEQVLPRSLTWFEEAIEALSSGKPNYRPMIGLILSDARELLSLSEKKDIKLYNKILKFVNDLEKAYVKKKFINSEFFLRSYFQLINFKSMLGEINEYQ